MNYTGTNYLSFAFSFPFRIGYVSVFQDCFVFRGAH